MKCPHCTVEFHNLGIRHPFPSVAGDSADTDGIWSFNLERCPRCERFTLVLICARHGGAGTFSIVAHPRHSARPPLPNEVPAKFAEDYKEACLVLADSPKASAALSRRCLQHVLREVGNTTKKDLFDQIDEVMPSLPASLRDLIDAVRVIGNIAAHPTKSTHTGEIVDVEPGEAELLLEILEMTFDFYFVQPAEAKRRKDAINAKLAAAGKPPMK